MPANAAGAAIAPVSGHVDRISTTARTPGAPYLRKRRDPGRLGHGIVHTGGIMKRHRGWLAAAATVPLLTLAACSGSSSPPSASSQQPVNQVFTYDTTVPVMVDGWDPATEYSDGIIAMSEMYETLTRYDSATKTVEPLLATSWSTSADGKTWTFHLRHGVYFHTGRLMTAQAAKAAIQRTVKLGGGAA